ncbi:hypothetical protein C8J57DRAFT_578652 [Mycena rebaudengoi]|nr:hypothetical protein C8J57DRAFT_578652 [Mycena rebaudengoi]
MPLSLPPAKRQRTDDAVPKAITRSEIWHDDGSVILQAANVQFRVHWSILSLHSSVFRGMRGVPQPPDQDTVEGCPVVELSDAVVDVECLLKALYDPLFNQISLPLHVITSIIRLSRKYDFKLLLDAAVERLTHENPTSLEEYDALLDENGGYSSTRVEYSASLLHDTIIVARENNLYSVLPSAYYRLLTEYCGRASIIFDGLARDDGTTAMLSHADQRACLIGEGNLLRAQFQAGNTWGWLLEKEYPTKDDGCTEVSVCTLKRETLFRNFAVPRLWALAYSPVYTASVFCRHCNSHFRSALSAGRNKIWEALPTFFDLPAWEELRNEL